MSELQRWYVACDDCGDISDHTEKFLRHAREAAVRDGFVRVGKRWRCRVCAKVSE